MKKIQTNLEAIAVQTYQPAKLNICIIYIPRLSLLSAVEKICKTIIETKLRSIIERTLEEVQSEFKKGYCTNDHIFTIRNSID